MKLLRFAGMFAFGYVVGATCQEVIHETGRCSNRSVKCPCEQRGAKDQYERAR